MVILNRVSRIFYILTLFVFIKCDFNNQSDTNKLTFEVSSSHIGINKYYEIQKKLRDTVETWSLNNLRDSKEITNYPYMIDSLICFNNNKDKLIGSILVRCNTNDCLQDDIILIYGLEINNLWYFIYGPTITLPREIYQKEIKTPITFDKLHTIALKEVYHNYLTKNKQINEGFFSDLTSGAWCTNCKTQEDWNEAYLGWVKNNWASRDTTKPIISLQPSL